MTTSKMTTDQRLTDCETENIALKKEVGQLRKQLAELQQKFDDLEEETLRKDMLFTQSNASLPIGDLVEIDEGYCLYTTLATPVLESVEGEESRQNEDHEYVPVRSEEEEGECTDRHQQQQEQSSPNPASESSSNNSITSIIVESYLHRISLRGPVRILSCRSAPLSADLFNNDVTTTNAFGINAVLNFLDVWDQWIINPVQGTVDTFSIRSAHGFYLCAEPDGKVIANRKVAKDWEHFTAVDQGDNKYAFRSFHGKYLCAEPDGKVVCDRQTAQRWEMFEVKLVA